MYQIWFSIRIHKFNLKWSNFIKGCIISKQKRNFAVQLSFRNVNVPIVFMSLDMYHSRRTVWKSGKESIVSHASMKTKLHTSMYFYQNLAESSITSSYERKYLHLSGPSQGLKIRRGACYTEWGWCAPLVEIVLKYRGPNLRVRWSEKVAVELLRKVKKKLRRYWEKKEKLEANCNGISAEFFGSQPASQPGKQKFKCLQLLSGASFCSGSLFLNNYDFKKCKSFSIFILKNNNNFFYFFTS